MYVIFIHGPAAAGKYTIGALVAQQLGLPLFHNHLTVDLATSLFDFGTEPFKRLRAEIWHASFRASAEADQSFVFTFHPEATVEKTVIDGLRATVADAGGVLYFVELVCSRAGVLERLQSESRQRFGKLTDPDLYEAIEARGGFAFTGLPPPDLRIDTESLDPEETAAVIVEWIGRSSDGHD